MEQSQVIVVDSLKDKKPNVVLKLISTSNKFVQQKNEIFQRIKSLLADEDNRKEIYDELEGIISSSDENALKDYLNETKLEVQQIIELTEVLLKDSCEKDIVQDLTKEIGLLNFYIVYILQKYQDLEDDYNSLKDDYELAKRHISRREDASLQFYEELKKLQKENQIVLNSRQKAIEKNLVRKLKRCG